MANSDKPIFFKPEDFGYTFSQNVPGIGNRDIELLSVSAASRIANTKVAPLLSAMEIMREALERISFSRGTNAGSVNASNYSEAREALNKCDEILK